MPDQPVREAGSVHQLLRSTYYSDYYLEEYMWKGFFRHNVFLDNCTHINTNGNLKEIEKVFIEDVSKKLGLK